MLTRDELGLLQGELALALSAGDPKNIIRVYLDINAATVLKDLPTNLSSNDEYASRVIDFCIRSRWSITPSLMEKLLVRLLAGGLSAGTAELTAALQRVQLGQDPNDSCYETFWVLREQPFLNRQSLRPVLKDFIQSSNRSLLQISGPGAGRTYTGELLDYLASQLDDLHCVPVKLNEEDGPSYKVQSLAADLLSSMGEDVPESPVATTRQSCAGAFCAQRRGNWDCGFLYLTASSNPICNLRSRNWSGFSPRSAQTLSIAGR